MIFSEQWIRQWVDPNIDSQELMDQLTMAGLEVEGAQPVANAISGIVVGLVESVSKHPDADKLNVCQVNDGTSVVQVVCGAANVRPGLKVPFATIGAQIQAVNDDKPFKIKKAKLRNVESFGMLCSTEELGLSDSADGLMELSDDAPLGQDVRDYLHLNDLSIELDLTPNRGDCLGMIGLAREIAVLNRVEVNYPGTVDIKATIEDSLAIDISATDECPRYLGRVIRNINADAETPLWMQEKLRRSGLRSIDPVVDVTNFVLLELGQPMHAFDLSKLDGSIEVRLAKSEETLTLLDGKELKLSSDTLVIADAQQALAMAGVMGGQHSAVSKSTEHVFLECAFFSQLAIAGKARAYGLHTDASHRYERGVDYQMQHQAMARATQLLLEIVGGEAGPVVEALGNLPEPKQVTLSFATIARLLGIEMATSEVVDILERLGFVIAEQNLQQLVVKVPPFRFDVSIEADLIEELARVYGYNNLPKTSGMLSQVLATEPENEVSLGKIKQQLVGLGYQEVITYSFIEPSMAQAINPENEHIVLQNPISVDLSVMRSSLFPGLLSSLKYNENRQQDRLRLFESGLVFHKEDGKTVQTVKIAGLLSGSKTPINWSDNNDLSDFYDVKGDVETLLAMGLKSANIQFSSAQLSALHSGQCAKIERDDELIGYIGCLHPSLQRSLGLNNKTYLFELSLEQLQRGEISKANDLSKYPEVSRDLAIVVDVAIAAGAIVDELRLQAGEYLRDLRIFDVYQGDAIGAGKKSIALGLTWQHPSRTLSDEDINTIITSCVKALEHKFNAKLRN
ncbi:MAG: phenylalanine--tRNA ligase subunit beta [SAR86 cluster bacterium]|uniref:Phenylalanine--tRNA ligase beta subunit n=1 Tax=SAR86 cluster bacterium TaxID=2030880 RepID=A0A2A4MH56_9GAMM|nr:MAG: phenylalanine--tRNA ligase subunit beta [SAR86 cluster bacterium]